MIRNINSDNKILFLLSKTNSIDLEALNLLAGKTEKILCGCTYCEHNGKHKLEYDVRLANSLYLQKIAFSLEKFIGKCLELLETVDKYDLNLVNVKTDARYIFTEGNQYQFLYIPVTEKKNISKSKFLFKLFTTFKRRDKRIAELLKNIKKMKSDTEVLIYLKDYIQVFDIKQTPSESETTLLSQNVLDLEGETTLLSSNQIIQEPESEGETTILSQHTTAFVPSDSAECETTFLSDNMNYLQEKQILSEEKCHLYLLRTSSGELIHINKAVYMIGKDIKNMDYVLGNESVSRNHATIYTEDNKFYLTDNGSTNGTTMEGIRVQMGEKIELSDGDIISLGNEVFQVLLERKVL